MKNILTILFLSLTGTATAQTQTFLSFSSGLSFSKEPGIYYAGGISFNDGGKVASLRLDFDIKYFDQRLSGEHRFGVQAGWFYPHFSFCFIPRKKGEFKPEANQRQTEKPDATNSVGVGLSFRFPLLNGSILELSASQSLFQYREGYRPVFVGVSVIEKL